MKYYFFSFIFSFLFSSLFFQDFLFAQINSRSFSEVYLGIDRVFEEEYAFVLKGKRIGLLTNQTGINRRGESTIDLFKQNEKKGNFTVVALYAPEHGLDGTFSAGSAVPTILRPQATPIYSLHGKTRRPTPDMLKGVDLLIYDIQDLGSRSYTYQTTLFYLMEEAVKVNIPVLVLDRPNPINGVTIDGPLLDLSFRSFLGHLEVPYCHGMTIGELATWFNEQHQVGCDLTIIPMKGWLREMSFADTGLFWIPTSPWIPESETAYYYPTTGILGELQWVSIGIGYTLPFKVVGAPWIDAAHFAQKLNQQNFPGVYFHPFHFVPHHGKFAKETCHGILIFITDRLSYLPVSTQYLILGMLKSVYPAKFFEMLSTHEASSSLFHKVNGTDAIYRILKEEQYPIWKLRGFHQEERIAFQKKRERYLFPQYSQKKLGASKIK